MSGDDWRRNLRVPSWCPVCQRVMKGSKSNSTYYSFDCCSDCHIEFVEDREDKWKDGWRPGEKQIEEFINKLHKKQ